MRQSMRWAAAAATVLALTSGCSSQEDKAREMHNQALTLQRSGSGDAAKQIYEEIIRKYPSTQTAVEANKELLAVATIDALEQFPSKVKEVLTAALELYILDNGTCPTLDQGLVSLVQKPTIPPIPVNWRAGGYLENSNYLRMVQSYSCHGIRFEIVMAGE